MKYILLTVTLFASAFCHANSSAIFNKLSQANAPSAQQILAKIEKSFASQGIIVEFELEFEKGITVYEVTLFDLNNNRFIELIVNAQGLVIEQEYEQPELDEEDEVAAAKLMKKKNYQMYQLVKQLSPAPPYYLIESQLEQDIGITYLVATFITAKGRHKKAIDLATGKNLPLLRWGN
ncbi:hypothetical protein CWC17_11355 [Pseudoalteromonas sp. S3785]|uniref:PepSY domain-containing protein n=1 Tax=Pseudoalteromonas sp. S3785 TaxID=579545 RepID=UPI00110C07C4|nr:PepSY domain-containing protein [Pseudoalteromonas sp. S3785]TMO73242.1 hypothetical protein CWC17_11355 [Pseudoalteromonas sp. S3785]